MPQLITRKRPIAEINIVPYVDVMLVLLVIFMVATPMLMQGVEVELPEATAESIQSVQEEPIVMSVDAQGQYFLNISSTPDKPLDALSIAQQVKEALTKDPKRSVLVKGDNKVAYGTVVGAMVILQQAGAPSVGLLTRTPEKE
jgi:biopolymer transport protein TolR